MTKLITQIDTKSEHLVGIVVDKVFDGAIEDSSVIYDILNCVFDALAYSTRAVYITPQPSLENKIKTDKYIWTDVAMCDGEGFEW